MQKNSSHFEIVRTACPYCGVGCGIEVTLQDGKPVQLRGDKNHPANFGKLCVKGSSLLETLHSEGRLLAPMVDGQVTDWDEATSVVARKFADTIKEYGPDSVAMYVSGQLLTEDYYVANKLAKGFWGTNNIDTNSRLCMSSVVAAQKRAFGMDTVPNVYADIELAKQIILLGSNAAWAHPILYQRISAAKKENPDLRIVVIDPRRTATCDIADQHLAVKPGSDGFLLNGLLNYIWHKGAFDKDYISQHCQGFENALIQSKKDAPDIDSVAKLCGLEVEEVESFYQNFVTIDKTLSLFSQGVNQSSSGVNKVNALINVHLATGRVGKEGCGLLSLTGQPNAMGGREVGGLANQLANHLNLANEHHRQLLSHFWKSPAINPQEGKKAIDLFSAIESGDIKALWVISTNPMVSLPESDRWRKALEACPFVVVSDIQQHTDTSQYADVLLPAKGWGEKEGLQTNSERRISKQNAFIESPGDCLSDWQIICQVAKQMGFAEAFDYKNGVEIIQEMAELSGVEQDAHRRDFDVSALQSMSENQYRRFKPIQWPLKDDTVSEKRFFAEGGFYTPNQKANFMVTPASLPVQICSQDYPFILNTGRYRDQWHTMTRTAKTSRLLNHREQAALHIHPDDAEKFKLQDGDLVKVSSRLGCVDVAVEISNQQQPGTLFMPIHWNDQYASNAVVDKLVLANVDAISGQPEFKQTPVSIEPLLFKWHGFVISEKDIDTGPFDYWVKVKSTRGYRYIVAGDHKPDNWHQWLWDQFVGDSSDSKFEMLRYKDDAQGHFRDALLNNNRLVATLFIRDQQSHYDLPAHQWLEGLFDQDEISELDRKYLLSGQSGSAEDSGAIICSCFSVGEKQIKQAIAEGCSSVEALGEKLKCGTNCGSCVPELSAFLEG